MTWHRDLYVICLHNNRNINLIKISSIRRIGNVGKIGKNRNLGKKLKISSDFKNLDLLLEWICRFDFW